MLIARKPFVFLSTAENCTVSFSFYERVFLSVIHLCFISENNLDKVVAVAM